MIIILHTCIFYFLLVRVQYRQKCGKKANFVRDEKQRVFRETKFSRRRGVIHIFFYSSNHQTKTGKLNEKEIKNESDVKYCEHVRNVTEDEQLYKTPSPMVF